MAKSIRIIDGLKTDTLYCFQARAKNVLGIWGDINDPVFHTTIKDTTTPPVLGSATLLLLAGCFQIKWAKPSTLDIRSGGFKIYVHTVDVPVEAKLIREVGYTSDGVEILIGEVTQDVSITITSGTTYYFWVTVLDASGNESPKVATTPGSGSVTSTSSTSSVDSVASSIVTVADSKDVSQSTLISNIDSRMISHGI